LLFRVGHAEAGKKSGLMEQDEQKLMEQGKEKIMEQGAEGMMKGSKPQLLGLP
jgi:hypothetical protein